MPDGLLKTASGPPPPTRNQDRVFPSIPQPKPYEPPALFYRSMSWCNEVANGIIIWSRQAITFVLSLNPHYQLMLVFLIPNYP